MATSGNAVVIHARARANAANMGSRTDALFADVGTNANTKHFHVRAGGICRDWCEER